MREYSYATRPKLIFPSSPLHITSQTHISINLQVIYESELGFLELRDYTAVSTRDASLIDTIRTSFPEVINNFPCIHYITP